MKSIEIKIPGKLYVAGEYAVVETGHTAILASVNRYITLTLTDSYRNELSIPHYEDSVSWPLGGELETEGEHWAFTAEAINTVTAYLKAKKIPLSPVKMLIETELIDNSGYKYGLGSSAAATTAVVKALLQKFAPETPLEIAFKLAALSHMVVQGNGSCGDIASCMYGGWIAYTTFDQEWFKHHLPYQPLAWFLTQPWPYLKIKRLITPDIPFLVGWTGTPVSTGKLVAQIQTFKNENCTAYEQFLTGTEDAVKQLLTAFHEKDYPLLFQAIEYNRILLEQLGIQANITIETPLLRKLAETSKKLGGAGKLSGSGGGDCGVAFSPDNKQITTLQKEWHEAGIKSLPFSTGVVQIKN